MQRHREHAPRWRNQLPRPQPVLRQPVLGPSPPAKRRGVLWQRQQLCCRAGMQRDVRQGNLWTGGVTPGVLVYWLPGSGAGPAMRLCPKLTRPFHPSHALSARLDFIVEQPGICNRVGVVAASLALATLPCLLAHWHPAQWCGLASVASLPGKSASICGPLQQMCHVPTAGQLQLLAAKPIPPSFTLLSLSFLELEPSLSRVGTCPHSFISEFSSETPTARCFYGPPLGPPVLLCVQLPLRPDPSNPPSRGPHCDSHPQLVLSTAEYNTHTHWGPPICLNVMPILCSTILDPFISELSAPFCIHMAFVLPSMLS